MLNAFKLSIMLLLVLSLSSACNHHHFTYVIKGLFWHKGCFSRDNTIFIINYSTLKCSKRWCLHLLFAYQQLCSFEPIIFSPKASLPFHHIFLSFNIQRFIFP